MVSEIPPIVWLASFPKSGNTWVRVFLTNYQRDGEEPAHINDLEGGWSYLLREHFDDLMGMASSDMTGDELNYYRPIFHQHLVSNLAKPLFIKTHEAYRRFPSGVSLFGPLSGCKTIHLVRNPLDVAVSFAHHNAMSLDQTIRKMANPNSTMSGGSLRFVEHMGTWSDHSASWLEQSELTRLTIRYEDLLEDAAGCFEKIVRFVGLEFDAQRLEKAIRFSSFDRLQQQEAATGFQERMPRAESFFRSGVSGDWATKLTQDQVEKIVRKHGAMMQRLGYELPQCF